MNRQHHLDDLMFAENGRSMKIMRRIPRVRGDQELIEFLAQISTPQRLVLMSYGDVADKLFFPSIVFVSKGIKFHDSIQTVIALRF